MSDTVILHEDDQEVFGEDEHGVKFVVAGDGNYICRKSDYYESAVKTRSEIPQVFLPHLDGSRCSSSFEFPEELLAEAFGFLQAVALKYNSAESALVLLRHPEHGLRWHCPEQSVSTAHVHFENPTPEDGWVRFGDIHSHPSFSNTPSGVDEHDETHLDGFHLIAAGLASPESSSISCTFCVDGKRFRMDDLADVPKREWVKPPKEWMKKVRRRDIYSYASSGGKKKKKKKKNTPARYSYATSKKPWISGIRTIMTLLEEIEKNGLRDKFSDEIMRDAEQYVEQNNFLV